MARGAALSEDEFGTRFIAGFRSLWLTALGVVHDPAGAEDVVQEAAVVALGKLDQFRPETSFLAWMSQIVRFVALNRSRRQQRRQTRSVEPETLATQVAAPGGPGELRLTESGQLPAYQEAFDDRVQEGLAALKPEARACLLLRTVEGLDYAQIAEAVGIPKGTAMSHVHRARKQLRQRLREHGGEGAAAGKEAP